MKNYLEKSPSIDRVEWSTLQNEARKPLLVVYPGFYSVLASQFNCNAFEIMLVMLTTKIFAAAKLVEVPGFFVRIIPSAKAIFSIAKLNLKRSNIHNLSDGLCLQHLFFCFTEIVAPSFDTEY